VNAPKDPFRSAMASQISSRLHALEVHRKLIQRQVAHLDSEASRFGKPGLFEGHSAAQRRLNREALISVDDYELRVFAIHLPTDLSGDSRIRSAIEGGCSIISVEEGHAEPGYGKCSRLAAAGEDRQQQSSREALAAEVAVRVLVHIRRQLLPDTPS